MAGEVYIADKVTLDQVKTNTDNILGNFPINGGTEFPNNPRRSILEINDLNNYTQTSDKYYILANISGEGVFQSLKFSFNYAARYSVARITIDNGTPLVLKYSANYDPQLVYGSNLAITNSMYEYTSILPFKNSLKVEIGYDGMSTFTNKSVVGECFYALR